MNAERLFAASVALYAAICALTNMALYSGASASTIAIVALAYEATLLLISRLRISNTLVHNVVAAIASTSPILAAAVIDSSRATGYLIAADAGAAVYVLVSSMCGYPRKSANI